MATVFGTNGCGGHNVSLRVGGLYVLITSEGPEQDDRALHLAEAIEATGRDVEAHAMRLQELRVEIEHRDAVIAALRVKLARADDALSAALDGRRRFLGPVLCVPARDGDWAGAIWLLDPDKREGGFGVHFDSLSEVRRTHPELWVIGATERGVLLDAVSIGGGR